LRRGCACSIVSGAESGYSGVNRAANRAANRTQEDTLIFIFEEAMFELLFFICDFALCFISAASLGGYRYE
jgi:hypothetical protein